MYSDGVHVEGLDLAILIHRDRDKEFTNVCGVRRQRPGRRQTFSLGTANKAAAAVKSGDLDNHSRAHGRDDTLAKFETSTLATVG
jgi:hypothetical protein